MICKNPIYKAQDKYETLMRLKDDALIPLEDVFYSAEDIVNTISVAKTYEAGRVIDTRYSKYLSLKLQCEPTPHCRGRLVCKLSLKYLEDLH